MVVIFLKFSLFVGIPSNNDADHDSSNSETLGEKLFIFYIVLWLYYKSFDN